MSALDLTRLDLFLVLFMAGSLTQIRCKHVVALGYIILTPIKPGGEEVNSTFIVRLDPNLLLELPHSYRA
jgi:hypothetical protein